MKLLILSFIILLSSKNCAYTLLKVLLDGGFLQTLDTSRTETGYFYVKLDRPTDKIYLYLADHNYHFKSNALEFCYTNKNPNEVDDAISTCDFKEQFFISSDITISTSLIEFVYKYEFKYEETKKYIIVHYRGLDYRGRLQAKASYDEIKIQKKYYEKMPEYVFEYDTSSAYDAAQTAVQAWVIIVIIITVVSVVGTVVVIVVVVCVCRRRTVYGGAPMGYVAQPGAVVYSPQAAAAYPLV